MLIFAPKRPADRRATLYLLPGKRAMTATQDSQAQIPVTVLTGYLGAGKTTFSRGFIQGLGHQGAVKSPTYTLVEPYEDLDPPVYHFDLYRLALCDELEDIGAVEFFHDPQGVSLVEWAERMTEMLPPARWEVQLEYGAGAADRTIRWRRPATVKTHGGKTE